MNPSKTLPGTIPGLLREGSPVLIPHLGEHTWTVFFIEESHQGPFVHVGRESTSRLVPLVTEEPANKVLLNLDDSTGFLHAKEWLWRACDSRPPGPQLHWVTHGSGRWFLAHPEGAYAFDIASLSPTEALRLACLQKAGL